MTEQEAMRVAKIANAALREVGHIDRVFGYWSDTRSKFLVATWWDHDEQEHRAVQLACEAVGVPGGFDPDACRCRREPDDDEEINSSTPGT